MSTPDPALSNGPTNGPTNDLTNDLARIPEGASEGWFEGARYGIRKETVAGGRSIKLYAERRADTDVISANVYRTARGVLLKPCEMPTARVRAFLRVVRTAAPEPPKGGDSPGAAAQDRGP